MYTLCCPENEKRIFSVYIGNIHHAMINVCSCKPNLFLNATQNDTLVITICSQKRKLLKPQHKTSSVFSLFTPRKAVMPLERRCLQGVRANEKTLMGIIWKKTKKKEHCSRGQKMAIEVASKCLKILVIRDARNWKCVPQMGGARKN